ncbi:hypothetical protein [Nonlabens ponticola]|uniref:Uncharacterized protein n=1 Tax=Nonlabens ponticola TaxID=2496866 RepID=A0A3S9MZS3_9FLAO|nr:hypothetical protein [Nonlabens ponticola]AZQ44766.1 hypothetical protein EJ995_11170 [Nonlabens ponticola]
MKTLYTICLLLIYVSGYSQLSKDDVKPLGLVSYLTFIKSDAELQLDSYEGQFKNFINEENQKIKSYRESLKSASDEEKKKIETDLALSEARISMLRIFRSDYIKEYINEKRVVDIFINQLNADMINKNALRFYRKINRYFTDDDAITGSNVLKYVSLVNELEAISFGSFQTDLPDAKDKNFVESATGVATLIGATPYAIYSDMKAGKKEKITGLTTILEGLKWKAITN